MTVEKRLVKACGGPPTGTLEQVRGPGPLGVQMWTGRCGPATGVVAWGHGLYSLGFPLTEGFEGIRGKSQKQSRVFWSACVKSRPSNACCCCSLPGTRSRRSRQHSMALWEADSVHDGFTRVCCHRHSK